jgi:hypothetical protein
MWGVVIPAVLFALWQLAMPHQPREVRALDATVGSGLRRGRLPHPFGEVERRGAQHQRHLGVR